MVILSPCIYSLDIVWHCGLVFLFEFIIVCSGNGQEIGLEASPGFSGTDGKAGAVCSRGMTIQALPLGGRPGLNSSFHGRSHCERVVFKYIISWYKPQIFFCKNPAKPLPSKAFRPSQSFKHSNDETRREEFGAGNSEAQILDFGFSFPVTTIFVAGTSISSLARAGSAGSLAPGPAARAKGRPRRRRRSE